jgi:hypothetical protein
MTTTKVSKVDREALKRALVLAKASDERGRREQIESMQERDWFEAAHFAAYHCQVNALQLRPWQSPPLYGRDADAAVLLRKLLDAGLSRYEPNPVAALAAIEARAQNDP